MVGLVLLAGLLGFVPARVPQTMNAVPVQVVSDLTVLGGPADNPSPEPATEDAATAPPEPTPPEPVPASPTPVPPAPPEKARTPRPTPPVTRPRPASPQPPKPAPPRREEPSLNLSDLAGPARPGPRRPTPRPPTGGGANGAAGQTMGPQVTAMFQQIIPNWILPCDVPGARNLRIQMDVTLSSDGRITSGPVLLSPRSDPVWRAAADGAMRALRQTAPFDVPRGFTGGSYRPTFNTEEACRNR